MNERSDQASGLNLPRPSGGEPGFALPPVTDVPSEPFRGTVMPTTAAGPHRQPAATDQPLSVVQPAQTAPQTDYEGIVADTEWIERAQDIIRQTQADPYAQSREISRLKAEYIKARYNKDIKVVEE